MIFLSIANLSQEHKLIDMQVWRNLSEYPNLWFGNTNLCKIYFNRFCRQTNLSQEYKLIDMQVWRNWQTRMVQVHMKAISCRFKSCYLHHEKPDFIGLFSFTSSKKQWQTHNIRIEILCLITINLLVVI